MANGAGPPISPSAPARKSAMIARVAIAPPIEALVNGLPVGASTVAPAFTQRSASRMSAVTTTLRGSAPLGDPVVGRVEPVADHHPLDQRAHRHAERRCC